MSGTVSPGRGGAETAESRHDVPGVSEKIPIRVGRYVVIGRLGEGGMGIVFDAFDPELDRRVAVKLLRPHRRGSDGQLRLLREAQAMARLSHPNVVQIYDVGVCGDRVFLAMELIEGRTVRAWLRERDRTSSEVVAVFVQAGRGLRAAHARGIIHRDFKPDNILVSETGRVCVADFGVARSLPSRDAATTTRCSGLTASLTDTGAAVGTPHYMAPEQHEGRELDARVDQFSFCVALHEAVFGELPLRGTTPSELATNAIHGLVQEPARPGRAPQWVRRVIQRGMSPDPDDRYRTFDDLLAALEADPPKAWRRRTRVAVTAGFLLGILGVGMRTSALDAKPEPCVGGDEALRASWNRSRRAATAAAYDGIRDDGLDGGLVLDALDDYAGRWTAAHRSACLAHVRGETSDARLDASMACLQRSRRALGRLARLVGEGEPKVLAAMPEAITRLYRPDDCIDVAALPRTHAAPADPAQAETVSRLAAEIAEAEAAHHAGALVEAVGELDALRGRIDAVGYPSISVELDLVEGRLAMDRKEWVLAEKKLGSALAIALEMGMDAVAAEAAARKLFVQAMRVDDLDRILLDAPVATGLVNRAGAPPALAALLTNNLGAIHAMRGRREEAARLFTEALRVAETAEDVNPVDHGNYLTNLALVTDDPDRRESLFARAQQRFHETFGERHIRSVELAILHARQVRDPATAVRLLAPACREARARLPEDAFGCHACTQRVGELYDQLGDQPRAVSTLRAAAACFEVDLAAEDVEHAQALRSMSLGHAAVLERDTARALEELGAAKRRLQPHADAPWIAKKLVEVNDLLGRVQAP